MTFSKGSVVEAHRGKRKTHTDQSFWASSDFLPKTMKMKWVVLDINQTNSENAQVLYLFSVFSIAREL